jgi:hypothetical protein
MHKPKMPAQLQNNNAAAVGFLAFVAGPEPSPLALLVFAPGFSQRKRA